jgi:hypothetical protein
MSAKHKLPDADLISLALGTYRQVFEDFHTNLVTRDLRCGHITCHFKHGRYLRHEATFIELASPEG